MQKINNFLHRLLYPYLRTPPLVSWFKKKGEQRYKQAEEKRKKLEAERKELIRIIAYHLWKDEGKQNNKDKYYWFKAVEEIKLINKLLKPVRKFTSKLRESLDKPLWEWLVEVIIPYLAIITAAGAVIYETNENRKNFKEEIKAIRTQIVKQDLIEYKRQILDLILNKKLLEAKDNNPEAVRAAKSLTSSTIKALDSEQNQDLTDFLSNMRLTQVSTLELLTNNNFTKAKLSRAKLSRANLSRTILYGADLSGADLSGAILTSAILHGADLSSAYLGAAKLRGANLDCADLRGADLSSADLDGILWNKQTNWKEVKGLETAHNIPEKLKQQLGL